MPSTALTCWYAWWYFSDGIRLGRKKLLLNTFHGPFTIDLLQVRLGVRLDVVLCCCFFLFLFAPLVYVGTAGKDTFFALCNEENVHPIVRERKREVNPRQRINCPI